MRKPRSTTCARPPTLARTATPAEGPHQIVLKIMRGRIALANNQLSTPARAWMPRSPRGARFSFR